MKDDKNEIKSDIGRNQLIVRKAMGISHIELVSITGLTRPILSKIENSTANPTLDTLIKLSKALNISYDILIMSKTKFELLKDISKIVYEQEKEEMFDFLLSDKTWKILMEYSGDETKKNCTKVAKICAQIITQNITPDFIDQKNSMILGATLGVIFQKDGFKTGLEFGAWLGSKLKIN